MAEDIDTLLDEVEDKFCDKNKSREKGSIGDHIKATSSIRPSVGQGKGSR